MACERWREMLSAQLDGEGEPAGTALVDEHLAGCAGCRQWLERAATVNRLTRTGVGVPGPDLTETIMAALPAPAPRKWPRLTTALYVVLAVVGAVQLILGLNQIGGGVAGAAHLHTGVDATPGHLWHESAAWNVALGAGYLFIALRRTRPAGLMPMLTAFVGMLLLLSVNDLTGGRVDATRLVSHGFVILGYLLIATLSKIPAGFAAPPGARAGEGSSWRASFADEGEAVAPALRPGLRLVPRGPMTAEHEERRAA
jgi:predicted anti-sigma-YlaC factor YlaD